MIHNLKTDPEYFELTRSGHKRAEIRIDDRGFKKGDKLRLRETQYSAAQMAAGAPLVYTGREMRVDVLHVLRGAVHGICEGFVMLTHTFPWEE